MEKNGVGAAAKQFLERGFDGPFALGNVTGNLSKAVENAFVILERGDHDVGPESRPILSKTPPFVFEAALLDGHFQLVVRFSTLDVFRRISGPVFGQCTLFLSSSPDDSNKRKDIGCFRCVGNGHFNAGSLGIPIGTEEVYLLPRQAGNQHDLVSLQRDFVCNPPFLCEGVVRNGFSSSVARDSHSPVAPSRRQRKRPNRGNVAIRTSPSGPAAALCA